MTARTALKNAVRTGVHLARRLGLPRPDPRARRAVAILRYHSVAGDGTENHRYIQPSLAVPADVFERQIAFLARCYRCLHMDELVDALAGGRPLPANAVVVTFDDGYRDNYSLAYPILRRHGVPAMFYLATGAIDGGEPMWPSELRYIVQGTAAPAVTDPVSGRRHPVRTPAEREAAISAIKGSLLPLPRARRRAALDELGASARVDRAPLSDTMMTWDQVREMHRGGMAFGAHTVSHPSLPWIPAAEAEREIAESRDELSARLRRRCDHFSYPNPGARLNWNAEIQALVRGAGFLSAVTSDAGCVTSGSDPWSLRRVAPGLRALDLAWAIERHAIAPPPPRPRIAAGSPAPARDGLGLSGVEVNR